jgi:hypothetical protein
MERRARLVIIETILINDDGFLDDFQDPIPRGEIYL